MQENRSRGFTIVELLIVIVIIGILAALVIVAYNGVQQRAVNASRVASAKEVQKLLNAYVAQEGKYPGSNACIGVGYTDWDGDGSLDCYHSNNIYHPQAAVDTQLRKVASIPKVETSDAKATSGGYTFRGYLYAYGGTVDGQPGRYVVYYYLNGTNQNCGVSGQLSSVSGGFAANGATSNNPNFYGTTRCVVAVNEP